MSQMTGRLKGYYVRFRVQDVHLPDPSAVLHELHGDDVLEGRVVDLSDSGEAGGTFVVIEVRGLMRPCIVAADRLLPATKRAWSH
jgi:hypothetical protein